MAYSLILVAAILKSNMAADKRKSQPGKLPIIIILEILRNILIPLASFYPECLADLIFRHKFGFCPLTIMLSSEHGFSYKCTLIEGRICALHVKHSELAERIFRA